MQQPFYPKCNENVWLRTCEEEIETPLAGNVTGTIPEWLSGSLLRNGPGATRVGKEEFQHLFDCSAMLHRFSISSGKVTYQCKFLRTDVYKKNHAANRIVVTGFGTKTVPDPCHTIFQRISSIFTKEFSDNAMVSVYPFHDELYAFPEVPMMHRFDPETLDTMEKVDLSKKFNIVTHTSHPHVMEDGTVYNLGVAVQRTGPHYIIVKFEKSRDEESSKSMFDNAKVVASIPSRWRFNPSYMHTFGMTQNYYLIVEQPLSISVPKTVISKFTREPMVGCLKWYEKEYTQIYVISRETGTVTHKFLSEAFFYLHIIHQYEQDDHIVLDVCAYNDPSVLDNMYLDAIRNFHTNSGYADLFRSRPLRFVLPLKPDGDELGSDSNLVTLEGSSAKAYRLKKDEVLVVPEELYNVGCETPRINYENYFGKPYKYFYAIAGYVDSAKPGSLIKVDVEKKACKFWYEEDCYLGEPIFVNKPDPKSEDDGVILSVAIWGKDEKRVGLLVLDARTFEEIGRAVFETPSPVPRCLHGWFLPSK